MQEQCHQGKSADNPHSHSSSGLRNVETFALKQGNQGPCNATNQPTKEAQHRPMGSRTAVAISPIRIEPSVGGSAMAPPATTVIRKTRSLMKRILPAIAALALSKGLTPWAIGSSETIKVW